MTYRFKIFPVDSEQGKRWYFHIKRIRGGKIVAQSEGYHRRADALKTVEALRANLADSEIEGEVEYAESLYA